MSPRRNKRSSIALPLRASGTDTAGNQFRQPVCTLDLSAEGARIHGLTGITVGQIVTLENKKNKVRFEVVWVGHANTPRQGQVGLRTLEPDKPLADLELQRGEFEDPWTPPAKPQTTAPPADRRATPRFECDRSVQYWKEDEKTPTWGTLENISLNGCFVTTRWPLPAQTRLRVVIYLYGLKISAAGQVRVSRPDEGMGIMFTGVSRESQVRLKKAVQRLAQKSGEPAVMAGGQDQRKNTSEEMLEAVLSFFDQNLNMSWDDFFDIAVRSKGNLPLVASQDEEQS